MSNPCGSPICQDVFATYSEETLLKAMTWTQAAMVATVNEQQCQQYTPCGTYHAPCTSCDPENPGTCLVDRKFDLKTNSAASSLIQSCEAASALSALEGECTSTDLGEGVKARVGDYVVLDSGDSFQNIDQGFRKCTGSSTWKVETCNVLDSDGNKCGCDELVKLTTSSDMDPMYLHQSLGDQEWCHTKAFAHNANAATSGMLKYAEATTNMNSLCPLSCPTPTAAPTTPTAEPTPVPTAAGPQMCTGCWAGTQGECKQANTVCSPAPCVHGTTAC